MRILHIHSGNLYGGVETVLRAMARVCALTPGIEMEFAVCFEGRIAKELRGAGCLVHVLGPARASHPMSVLRARARLATLFRERWYGATVAHSTWTLALLAPAAQRPLIYYQHDMLSAGHWTGRMARRTRPDLVVANSATSAATTAVVFPRTPVDVIHPPAELRDGRAGVASRMELRGRWGVPHDALLILQAARFEGWKGHRLLLEALATLRDDPRWFLWIAGEAQRPAEVELRGELEARAARLQIARRVSFIGHVTDMAKVMNAADIYCQPNLAPEAFGLAYVEALHAELTVIGTAMGGAKEILSPDYGLLPEPEVDSLAAALGRAIRDPGLRDALAKRGPFRARSLCDARSQTGALAQSIERWKEASAAA